MFHGSTSPADKQRAMGVLTEGTNLPDATVPGVTDKQRAMGVLTEGTNLPDATVPGVTDKQRAVGVLTEGTNRLGPGGEGQTNRSHDC